MDEKKTVTANDISTEDFMKPRCKVKLGDRIYRKHRNMTVPDRMEVTDVTPTETGYFIKCKYMYHGIGVQERTFSDVIFRDENWVVEKKGVDF